MTNEKKASVTLLKKQKDESYVPEACKKIGISDTTLFRWIREKTVPAKRRIGGLVLKDSAVEKIRLAVATHKRDKWRKEVEFTDQEEFFGATHESTSPHQHGYGQRASVNLCSPRPENQTLTSKQKEMSQMAKRLHAIGEPELAARVSHKVVMEIEL